MHLLGRRSARTSRLVVVVAGLAAAASLVVPASSTGPSASAAAPGRSAPDQVSADVVPTLDWAPCDDYAAPAECTTARLPLDYDDPTGPTTKVAALRIPARHPAERIGTLFVNPGGPGGSARDFASFARQVFSREVTNRFDVVGIDPRGVGASGFARCDVPRGSFQRVSYPITRAETRDYVRRDRLVTDGCRASRSRIVDHMSTADTARDMDAFRQALGDDEITYYGISYGSYLGSTYAALFPDHVRALVIDGVLDPVAWSTGREQADVPVTYRLRSGYGSYEALSQALVECDRVGKRRCPAAGDAYGTWQRLYRAAAAGRLRVQGIEVGPQDLVGNALGSLYDPVGIRFLVDFLHEAATSLDRGARSVSSAAGEAWQHLVAQRRAVDRVGPYGSVVAARGADDTVPAGVSFQGVLCADSVNPSAPGAWVRTAARADRQQPWFGRTWTWSSSTCGRWPAATQDDAFRGPWPTTTSNPLLVIGNLHDPATPISGARSANRLFAGSVLLTLDAFGHGALGSGSCIENRLTSYLVDQELPVPGRVCQPDRPLYPRRG